MRHLARHGYPVPLVHDVDGDDVVMERLHGDTMLSALEAKPWRARALADQLADLHVRLAAVAVGDLGDVVPSRFGPPTSIIHLDFHPDNVMLTTRGPIVFDWTNAALGPAAADVAQTWVVGGDVDHRRHRSHPARRRRGAQPLRAPLRRALRPGRGGGPAARRRRKPASSTPTSAPKKPTASAP